MLTAEAILQDKGLNAHNLISTDKGETVEKCLKLMAEKKIGAMLVSDGGNIVGIWTERDLLRNALMPDFDVKKTKLGEVMTKNLIKVKGTATLYELMDKFLGLHLRHLPVEKDGKIIGLLSSGDVMHATLIEKDKELKKLHEIASWQYYEEWRPPAK